MIEAKSNDYRKESARKIEVLVTNEEGSRHETDASIRRLKVKGLKFDTERLLKSIGLSVKTLEEVKSKKYPLEEFKLRALAISLECPLTVVMKLADTKGESDMEPTTSTEIMDMPAETTMTEPMAKKRGRPKGSKNKTSARIPDVPVSQKEEVKKKVRYAMDQLNSVMDELTIA